MTADEHESWHPLILFLDIILEYDYEYADKLIIMEISWFLVKFVFGLKIFGPV